MGSNPVEVNAVLARCDLERVVREHLRGGVDPGRLLGELLEMCISLRQLLQDGAVGGESLRPSGDAQRDAKAAPALTKPGRQADRNHAGMNVRWLRPVAEIRPSSRGHHVECKTDADESLPHD